MKLTKILLTFFLLLSTVHAVDIPWNHDYNKALAQAKKEHKIIYLFIGADNCKYCKRLYEWTLSKPEVIKKMKKDYILLYMSRDQHDIPKQYERYGAPRHYFINYKEEIIHSDQGSREPEGWYDILDEVDLKKDDFEI